MGRLDGRAAIVTGAAMGIGEGIARVLAREGARVALADVADAEGERVAEDLRNQGADAFFVHADVSKESDVKALVAATLERFGAIDILVNNAGIGVYKTILDTTPEEWDRCLAVNLKGVYLCSREVIPHMQKRRRGAVINIASVHAYQNVAATSPYAASKGGVVALTRTMAIDFARDGIRVNAVCPGWIETPLTRRIFAESGDF
ncbi:MAG: glucose 1-dehydrogenase, partial [Clostridia bacterium]|nr:glucose 1-dehydrogenase [Clostridia bacterium]